MIEYYNTKQITYMHERTGVGISKIKSVIDILKKYGMIPTNKMIYQYLKLTGQIAKVKGVNNRRTGREHWTERDFVTTAWRTCYPKENN